MPIPDLLLNAMVTRDITQYPDPTLYKAAALLRPEERPTVPVRLQDKNEWNSLYQRLFNNTTGNPNARAVTGPQHDTIYINRQQKANRDIYKLAAALAHEQTHIKRNDLVESPAYETEMQVLQRLRSHVPVDYREAMATRLATLRGVEKGK